MSHAIVSRWQFGAYDHVAIDGREYRCIASGGGSHVMQGGDGLQQVLSDADVTRLLRSPTFEFERGRHEPAKKSARDQADASFVADLDPAEADLVRWRARFCDDLFEAIKSGKGRSDEAYSASIAATQEQLEAEWRGDRKALAGLVNLKRRYPPGVRTVRRWAKKYERFGFAQIGLRTRKRLCGNRKPKLAPEIRRLVAKVAQKYLSETRPTVANLHDALRGEVSALNDERAIEGLKPFPTPSRETLRKEVGLLPAYTKVAARHGVQKAVRTFGMVGQGLDVLYPLQRVEIDNWEVSLQTFLEGSDLWDLLASENQRQIRATRMMLCVAIDCATRCVLGMRLSETADARAAMATLEMAVSSEKERYADLGATLSSWHMCGTFYELAADSGSEFLLEVIGAATDLGARHVKPPAGRPEHRARIERFFGTLHTRLMPLFTGRTFEHVQALGDYPSQARASLDSAALASVLVRYVVDAYHNTPHGGLGQETPREAWDRLTKLYPVAPPPSMHARRSIFGVALGARTVGKRGVRVMNLDYTSFDLQAAWRREGTLEVPVKVDPLDLGFVSARVADKWLPLRCSTDGLDGVSASEWDVAWSRLRQANAAGASLAQRVVEEAIRDIQAVARDSRRRVGIHLELPDAKSIARAEERMSAGFTLPNRYGDHRAVGLDDPFGDTFVAPGSPKDGAAAADPEMKARDSPEPKPRPRDHDNANAQSGDATGIPKQTNNVTFED